MKTRQPHLPGHLLAGAALAVAALFLAGCGGAAESSPRPTGAAPVTDQTSQAPVTGPATSTSPRPQAQPDPPESPCRAGVRACVSLSDKQAWLLDEDGEVELGPVRIAHGGKRYATPTGTFRVEWKDKEHYSSEFNNAPMPFSVFFAPGGIAFHQGDLDTTSHGCVRLSAKHARTFFHGLTIGDTVKVRR